MVVTPLLSDQAKISWLDFHAVKLKLPGSGPEVRKLVFKNKLNKIAIYNQLTIS